MFRKGFILLVFMCMVTGLWSQSPHGSDFVISCSDCHNTEGWTVDASSMVFDHDSTGFMLEGRHSAVSCVDCHQTLIFSEANDACVSCHTDLHRNTLGEDCARCHTSNNWLVDNIQELHLNNGFQLVGIHKELLCVDCHTSSPELLFPRIGNDCISCHETDFQESQSPDHTLTGLSTNCTDCHNAEARDWSAEFFSHDFYPLEKAHSEISCASCHTDPNYSTTPADCFSCHEQDYIEAVKVDHRGLNLSVSCTDCHDTSPDWMPADFSIHDDFFPIYSGGHLGTWDACVDCHTTGERYMQFECINCHLNPETDNQHSAVSGYFYADAACIACHPTGEADVLFDHNTTNFPLTGAHEETSCILCHGNGFEGTPMECMACHQTDYISTVEPDHERLNLSTDCASCHTTEPGWRPASFPIHDEFYELRGAHKAIENDCAQCHSNGFSNTPNTCVGCHQPEYEATVNPDHESAGFTTECASCHGESSWVPVERFDIHDEYYVLRGAHKLIENQCASCHADGYAGTPNTCVGCHQENYDNTIAPDHGELLISTNCAECHSEDAWVPATFDHNVYYEFRGAHQAIANQCAECHQPGFANTPNTCVGCHREDYTTTEDPDHEKLGFSISCAECHSEESWEPASINHDQFYVLRGAHKTIENQCASCHADGYAGTPNTCFGCHSEDYTTAESPNHLSLNFSVNCASCHSEEAWKPGNFDHDQYYPLLGAHAVIANQCSMCHRNGIQNTPNTCVGCHRKDYNESVDPSHIQLGLSTDCKTCHSVSAWSPSTFDHDPLYELKGAHKVIEDQCVTCHAEGVANTPNTCVGCHQSDVNNVIDPDHQKLGFSTMCTDCHSEDAWSPASVDHDQFYVLRGAHKTIENQCASCHADGFANTPTDCFSCHTADYRDAKEPDHELLGFGTSCTDCHSEDSWSPSSFDHDQFYVLRGAHKRIENQCTSCHADGTANTPTDCFGCHADDFNNALEPNHVQMQFSSNCVECHSEDSWSPSSFDHDQFYVLRGAHKRIENQCTSCHADGTANTPTDCIGCHTDNYINAVSPNHVQLELSSNCVECHGEDSWSPSSFDHDPFYVLRGAHKLIENECASCHSNGTANTPTDCIGCHTDNYINAVSPNHVQLELSSNCVECHGEDSWSPSSFDHDQFYVLRGAHKLIENECASCHSNGTANTPTTCYGCHTSEYDNSVDPNHQALNFATTCTDCHTEEAWSPAEFDHDQVYVLNGAHRLIQNQCASCHSNGYSNTPTDCAGCHTDDYNASANPDHQVLGLSMNCTDCHGEDSWSPSGFDHDEYYVLEGAHRAVNDCAACHSSGVTNTPTDCFGCHNTDYDNITDPNHRELGFPTSCTECHSQEAWSPADFDHDQYYVLRGAHKIIENQCTSCHANGYSNTPTTCFGCHSEDYNNILEPNHQQLNFSTTCTECHSEDAWSPATFDHDQYYVLRGAHKVIENQCASCHSNGYSNTPTDCAGCHTDDYNASVNPDHEVLGLSMACTDCHGETSWVPSMFDHDQYYVLQGAHQVIENQCASCHSNGVSNTPTTCFGCHSSDYTNANDPDHQTLGFPTTCTDCHSQDAWEPADFDHDQFYVLQGAHKLIENQCSSCHANGYSNTPNTCFGCHSSDYTNANDPDHQTLGFPTTCTDCHSQTAWEPADFDHDQFYVLQGAHKLIENQCNSCHANGYSNTPKTCFGCHSSDYTNANDPDHQSLNFSTTCTDCHSQTAWVPADFDHDQFYVLQGAHKTIENQCTRCHTNGYTNTPTTCFGCHSSDYNNANDPNHASSGFSTNCTDCHSQTAWEPSTFDHDSDYFPIYRGNHRGEWDRCTDCHTTPNNFSLFSCIDCHEHNNAAELAREHDDVSGYVFQSTACYACHPRGDD